jgi:anaerobic magnesium-protoporphyrin IX monomethyl ester cyclase
VLDTQQIAALKRNRPELAADVNFRGTPVKVMACGGGADAPQATEEALAGS